MAIEWGFLILLAVGAGIADLRPLLIILVMAIGWVLVVLVELLAWRARPAYAVTESLSDAPPEAAEARQPIAEPIPPAPPPTEEPPAKPRPAAGVSPAYDFEFEPRTTPAEEQTDVVAPERPVAAPQEEAAPIAVAEEDERRALDPDDPYAPAPERASLREGDQRVVHRLEPLKPRRPRRRWFRRGQDEEGA
jgi:hypothetical protein